MPVVQGPRVEWTAVPTHGDLVQVAGLLSQFWAQVIPGEPATSPDELVVELDHPSPIVRTWYLLARDAGRVVGVAKGYVELLEGYDHVAWLEYLVVASDRRRRGVGRALVAALVERCRAEGLALVSATVPRDLPGTAAFARSVGARPGLVQRQNRARVADLDRPMLEGWVRRAGERADGYSLVVFDGRCPDELLTRFARVVEVMNGAPHSEAVGEFAITSTQVGEHRGALLDRGCSIWTVCARHDASAELVGYSELVFDPRRPWVVDQEDTGVHESHRDRGLGRWLKAHNALRLLDEHPDVEVVETWNAGVNQAMLSINDAMGFRPVALWQEWELDP